MDQTFEQILNIRIQDIMDKVRMLKLLYNPSRRDAKLVSQLLKDQTNKVLEMMRLQDKLTLEDFE